MRRLTVLLVLALVVVSCSGDGADDTPATIATEGAAGRLDVAHQLFTTFHTEVIGGLSHEDIAAQWPTVAKEADAVLEGLEVETESAEFDDLFNWLFSLSEVRKGYAVVFNAISGLATGETAATDVDAALLDAAEAMNLAQEARLAALG